MTRDLPLRRVLHAPSRSLIPHPRLQRGCQATHGEPVEWRGRFRSELHTYR